VFVSACSAADVEIPAQHHMAELVFLGYTAVDAVSTVPGAVDGVGEDCMQPGVGPGSKKDPSRGVSAAVSAGWMRGVGMRHVGGTGAGTMRGGGRTACSPGRAAGIGAWGRVACSPRGTAGIGAGGGGLRAVPEALPGLVWGRWGRGASSSLSMKKGLALVPAPRGAEGRASFSS